MLPVMEEREMTVLSNEHHSTLYATLSEHSYKWKDIGTHLGFRPSELEKIQATPLLLLEGPNGYLRAMLVEWLEWAPGDGRRSGRVATLGGLRDALNKAGLPEPARAIMTLELST